MLKVILHVFGRILVNIHLIVLISLVASASWIVENTPYSNWQVGLAALGLFAIVFLSRCLIFSKYVTGKWGFRDLNKFYSRDQANRFYEPWEQKRLFEEGF